MFLPFEDQQKYITWNCRKFRKNKHFQFLSFTFDPERTAGHVAKQYKLSYEIICLSRHDIYPLLFNLGFPATIITDQTRRIKYMKSGGPNHESAAAESFQELYSPLIDKLLAGVGP